MIAQNNFIFNFICTSIKKWREKILESFDVVGKSRFNSILSQWGKANNHSFQLKKIQFQKYSFRTENYRITFSDEVSKRNVAICEFSRYFKYPVNQLQRSAPQENEQNKE